MRKRFLLTALMFAFALNNFGIESDLIQLEDASPFSSAFLRDLEAAANGTNRIQKLEEFYAKLTNAAEQAETELTFARIFGQRTGFVNPARAVEWYDKALTRNLPPTALARQFILRGGAHEQLKHPQEALADYIRGLLVCLQFNLPNQLPEQWPKWDGQGKLHPPPMNNFVGFGEPTPAKRLAAQQQYADYRREMDLIRREQDLLSHRFYYIDGIRRIMKTEGLDESGLRAAVEKLTNRQDRLNELLRRVREPNPRPHP